MIRKIKYILILVLASLFVSISAQNSQVLYYMNLPQNHLLNPAMRPSNSLYIGLPVISGINMNINNNFFKFSDVFKNSPTSDSVYTFLNPKSNISDFINKIQDKNSIEPEMSIQTFGLGFNAGKDLYVFFDINERLDANGVIPGDIFKFALLGNAQFQGGQIDLSSFRADVKYYREIGLGFSKNITNKLRIGVKGKILSGIATASIDNKLFGISISDTYTHTIDVDLVANLSAPLTITKNSGNDITGVNFDDSALKNANGIADFVRGKKNTGLGLDIGATYSVTPKFVVSAAITDVGYIKWKKSVNNIEVKGHYVFNGIDLHSIFNETTPIGNINPGQSILDSLKKDFKVTNSKNVFTTYLPFGITLGGSYNLTKAVSVGILSYSRVIGKQVRESLTASANLNMGNAFSTSFTYTIANHQFDNLGAGIAFRPGIFQFYLLADRIPITWNKIKSGNSTIPIPTSVNTINLRLGMNIAFGNKAKQKLDKPMLKVE
jgi:hypothetical protein